MTNKEKLLEEFNAAILAELGDKAELEFGNEKFTIEQSDIDSIAHKVKFYLFK